MTKDEIRTLIEAGLPGVHRASLLELREMLHQVECCRMPAVR